jgi:[1-hydroxy-2-(trimethylamino)ethyl]phosphonate dioxygenase
MDIVDQILELFEARGAAAYLGEPVSQTEHALQSAYLAVQKGASDALVTAALLHDIGHLLGSEDDPAERGIDAVHEDRGCSWLTTHFGPEVTEPVRLHVMAKRYLCAVDAAYRGLLSPASIRSLELQGGALTTREAEDFEHDPHAVGGIRLRRWDDRAKIPQLDVPGLDHYTATLRRLKRPEAPEP